MRELGPIENWYSQTPSRDGAHTGSDPVLPSNNVVSNCWVFWFVHEAASVESCTGSDFDVGNYSEQLMASQRPNPKAIHSLVQDPVKY